MSAPDPALVAAVLAEEWRQGQLDKKSVSYVNGGDEDHEWEERMRQTVLGHRLLQWASKDGDCIACGGDNKDDCPVCSIVAELRGGAPEQGERR